MLPISLLDSLYLYLLNVHDYAYTYVLYPLIDDKRQVLVVSLVSCKL